MNISKESKSLFVLVLLLIIASIVMAILSKGLDSGSDFKFLWLFLFLYILVFGLVRFIFHKYPNAYIGKLNYYISIPISLGFFLFSVAIPFMTIIFHVVLYFMISISIPLILKYFNDQTNYIRLDEHTILFIFLTFASCVSIMFYKQILYLIYKFGPLRIKDSVKMKKYKLDELTEYVINKENLRFTIYTAFFLYLLIFSFQLLQNTSVFEIANKDKAVYQAFLCFIAFDRLLINSKNIALLPSVLLTKVLEVIYPKDKET